MTAKKSWRDAVITYANDVVEGRHKAGNNVRECRRFLHDLERDDIELRCHDPDFVINIIQLTFVHREGESLDGEPLMNKPLILQPFQLFIVYNLVGWFWTKKKKQRRYNQAFLFIPRKNGKSLFAAALAWGLGVLERMSGSTVYIAAAALKQSLKAFDDMKYSMKHQHINEEPGYTIHDNNNEHSIELVFTDDAGEQHGSFKTIALACNPDAQDSFVCNIAILDEIHAFKKAAQYNRFREAQKSFTNKLCIGITTAGDNVNSFGYRRLEYAEKVLDGIIDDDELFCFVSHADIDEKGDVDYTNPEQWEKANPGYGVTIRPEDMAHDAMEALNDPQQRKDFLSRSLNVYTTALKAWFNIDEFKQSDRKYSWTIHELAKLPVHWFGGVDLSRMYDLTAAALFGQYKGVDIIVTHAFFPVVQAAAKADEDGIPLFGWEDDGWLTMCNNPTVNVSDVVDWFIHMRSIGFKIAEVGHDKKFAREYYTEMKKAKFRVVDQSQYFYVKSEGFRYIEKAAKDGLLYYLHSDAYEYCVKNVHAIETTDDMVRYEKTGEHDRIDLFDASVFACVRFLANSEKQKSANEWWGE